MEGIEIDEDHPKVIIHIDIDYFYAQVEEIHDPSLKTKPLGIQQNRSLVTANYLAREFGVQKLMTVVDALKLCPNLVLVNGEDLNKYRDMSNKIFEIMKSVTCAVEKLGFDENYADVTNQVNDRLAIIMENREKLEPIGHLMSDRNSFTLCNCGCENRLIVGSIIAQEIRDRLFAELGITSCAGIAHNKILAKLIGSANKPNKQTVLAPVCASTFMSSLGSVRNITGIGTKTESLLNEINITTIQQLQDCELDKLQKKFGYDSACRLKDLSFGRDYSLIRPSGKPKSIGLEDSCKTISVKSEVEEKFRLLLVRLVKQIRDDGRIPVAIKIIIRKYDVSKKASHREMKQCNILSSLFKQTSDGKTEVVDGGLDKLHKIVMRLFDKCIDMKKPFHITLIGLAFIKFQARKTGSHSIANFLIKKADIEVQSVTNLSNESSFDDSSSAKAITMELEPLSDSSLNVSDNFSEAETEPSPKKTRLELLIAKQRCISSSSVDTMDIASPSKLGIAELRLNSSDCECSSLRKINNNIEKEGSITPLVKCPPGVDPDVFKELPIDVQNELISSWRSPSTQIFPPGTLTAGVSGASNTSTPKLKSSTLHRYFIKNK